MKQHVYIVQGEHWDVPGRPLTVHANLASASARALELVNIMLKDLNLPPHVDWRKGFKQVKKAVAKIDYDHPEPDVWIDKREVLS